MARLDVYRLPNGPLVVDVQVDLLDNLTTRVAIPLLPVDRAPRPIRDLNPIFSIGGESFVLLTQDIGSVPARDLRRPVASLAVEHDTVLRALDLLLTGI